MYEEVARAERAPLHTWHGHNELRATRNFVINNHDTTKNSQRYVAPSEHHSALTVSSLARLGHVRRVPIATNQKHDVPNSYVNLWLELIVDMKTR